MTLRLLPGFLRAVAACLRSRQYVVMAIDGKVGGSVDVRFSALACPHDIRRSAELVAGQLRDEIAQDTAVRAAKTILNACDGNRTM